MRWPLPKLSKTTRLAFVPVLAYGIVAALTFAAYAMVRWGLAPSGVTPLTVQPDRALADNPFERTAGNHLPRWDELVAWPTEQYPTQPNPRWPTRFVYEPRSLNPLRDQGACNSCWAQALCAVLEDRVSLSSNHRLDVPLSAQQLISCSAAFTTCKAGGDLLTALTYVESMGISPDTFFPYAVGKASDTVPTCSFSIRSSYRVHLDPAAWHRSEIREDGRHILLMKQWLYEQGPLLVSLAYDPSALWHLASGGVYQPTTATGLYHTVELVGWDDTHWVLRNSWGDDWPQTGGAWPGYFFVPLGTNVGSVEEFVLNLTPLVVQRDVISVLPRALTTYETYDSDQHHLTWERNVSYMLYAVIGTAVLWVSSVILAVLQHYVSPQKALWGLAAILAIGVLILTLSLVLGDGTTSTASWLPDVSQDQYAPLTQSIPTVQRLRFPLYATPTNRGSLTGQVTLVLTASDVVPTVTTPILSLPLLGTTASTLPVVTVTSTTVTMVLTDTIAWSWDVPAGNALVLYSVDNLSLEVLTSTAQCHWAKGVFTTPTTWTTRELHCHQGLPWRSLPSTGAVQWGTESIRTTSEPLVWAACSTDPALLNRGTELEVYRGTTLVGSWTETPVAGRGYYVAASNTLNIVCGNNVGQQWQWTGTEFVAGASTSWSTTAAMAVLRTGSDGESRCLVGLDNQQRLWAMDVAIGQPYIVATTVTHYAGVGGLGLLPLLVWVDTTRTVWSLEALAVTVTKRTDWNTSPQQITVWATTPASIDLTTLDHRVALALDTTLMVSDDRRQWVPMVEVDCAATTLKNWQPRRATPSPPPTTTT